MAVDAQMGAPLGRVTEAAATAMATAGVRFLTEAELSADGPSASLISKTQAALRRDIIRHHLAPGRRLKIQELTERYGVGLSPIREALSLMCASGLVIREDRRGFRVAPVSLADYHDARLVLARLWYYAMTLSIANGDQAWEQRLVLALYRTLKFDWARAEKEPELYREWDDAWRVLQLEFVSGSGSPTLMAVIDTLLDRVERYRWLVPEVKTDSARDDRNHRAIVDAMVARDPDKLRQALSGYMGAGAVQRAAIEAKLQSR